MTDIKMKTDNGQPSKEAPAVSNEQILELLQKQSKALEAANAKIGELELKQDPGYEIRESRKKYDGPRFYSYGLINGKPITSWKTTLDTQFQNPYTRKWEAKQEIEITFYDGKKQTLDIILWGRDLQRSKKMIPKKEEVKKELPGQFFYTFEHDGKEFEIERTFINP